jgi:hypothetical protein
MPNTLWISTCKQKVQKLAFVKKEQMNFGEITKMEGVTENPWATPFCVQK